MEPCIFCERPFREDEIALLVAAHGHPHLIHGECRALAHNVDVMKAIAKVVVDEDFDRCRHRAGTVGGRCVDCGAAA